MGQLFDIWVVIGTRPEAIKQIPLYRALVNRLGPNRVGLISTGQHKELLSQALEHFNVKTDFNLELMKPGQRLGQSAAGVLTCMSEILADSNRPKMIIVQGDTSTAAMTAIAAFHEKILIVHNEAGLRTYDLENPYPEEANRKWIGVIADYHFAPTERAREALLREKVPAEKIFVVGNTGIDAFIWALSQPCPESTKSMLFDFRTRNIRPVLVTAHRRENDVSKMDSWFKSLGQFAESRKDIVLVCPMHPNNLAIGSALKHLGSNDRVWIGPSLDYAEICHLLKECRFVVTDSGGIQEESATLGIPSVVCRKVTERYEGIEIGIARLADPSNGKMILDEMAWAYDFSLSAECTKLKNRFPFGDGSASEKIVGLLFPESQENLKSRDALTEMK